MTITNNRITELKLHPVISGFPRAIEKIDKPIRDLKEFDQHVTEVRIDYVQHALSAMIQYVEYFGRTNTS